MVMYNDENKDQPQLSQSAYILIGSFSTFSRSLLLAFGMALVIIIIAAGVFHSIGEDSLTTIFLYFFFFLLAYFLLYYLKSRKFSKHLKIWKKNYFDQIYTIIFNTTIPKGNNEIEKILFLSRYIFPELSYDFIKYSSDYIDNLRYYLKSKFSDVKKIEEKRILKAMNYKVNRNTFDLALKTDRGYFIIKNFDDKIVNINDIAHLAEKTKSKFKNIYQRTNILRILIVAKNYDEPFLERASLEEIMIQKIKPKLKIDLIVKENIGYSVLWISPYL